jgi:hypothetical protein
LGVSEEAQHARGGNLTALRALARSVAERQNKKCGRSPPYPSAINLKTVVMTLHTSIESTNLCPTDAVTAAAAALTSASHHSSKTTRIIAIANILSAGLCFDVKTIKRKILRTQN